MNDTQIVKTIDELVDEEHRLERTHSDRGLTDEEKVRLEEVEARLDQCWDLLRQRRARRHAGLDPDDAVVRSPAVVEHYQQ